MNSYSVYVRRIQETAVIIEASSYEEAEEKVEEMIEKDTIDFDRYFDEDQDTEEIVCI